MRAPVVVEKVMQRFDVKHTFSNSLKIDAHVHIDSSSFGIDRPIYNLSREFDKVDRHEKAYSRLASVGTIIQ